MRPESSYAGPTSNVTPGGHRNLAYDQYAEMSKQTQAARANAVINVAQLAMMSQMGESLNNISAVMQDVRSQHSEALAIQQELLQEDRLQAYIEEFIYSTEKLVEECSKKESELALSSRYFLLIGIQKTVSQQGLATPVIRGRDNKAAFDKGLADVQSLIARLEQQDEVKEAIAWSEEERRKREEEAERTKKKKEEQARLARKKKEEAGREKQKLKQEINALSKRKDHLISQRDIIDMGVMLTLGGWLKTKHQEFLGDKSLIFKLVAYNILFWFSLLTVPMIFVWFMVEKNAKCQESNVEVNKEIEGLQKEINKLSGKMSQ